MEQILLTDSEKIKYSTSDIGKILKQQLKKKYPHCKFSIQAEYYSGGSSLNVYLMESNIKIRQDFKDILPEVIEQKKQDRYSEEDIKNFQSKGYHQLNHYQVLQDYNSAEWCNGLFLTKEGHELFKDVVQFTNVYNWDNSDSMIDYFDVHFYLHINLGKWDKDFIQN